MLNVALAFFFISSLMAIYSLATGWQPGRRKVKERVRERLDVGPILRDAAVAREPRPRERKPVEVQLAPTQRPVKRKLVANEIDGPGLFEVKVVGASRCQRELERLAGGRTEGGVDVLSLASLVLEDSNPHDPKAVRVDMGGRTVGYLDRQGAREYRTSLAKAGMAGKSLFVAARIVGGWDRGGDDQGHFGVRLDLPVG